MNDEVQRQYGTSRNLAARGSFHGKYGTANWFEWVVDRMAISHPAGVLDVGCGPAWLWLSQANRLPKGSRLTMVDASAGMIAEAKANLARSTDLDGRTEFHVGDAASLPFADASFDVALLLHVLYHVDDRRTALEEARRVLRPGGRLFVSTNALDNVVELHAIGARVFGGDAVDPGAARFCLDDAEHELEALFADVRRYDLTDIMTCNDPEDAVAVLLSMPPGNAATPEQRERLAAIMHEEAERRGGNLTVTRRTGLVEARMLAAPGPSIGRYAMVSSISANGGFSTPNLVEDAPARPRSEPPMAR
jgi:SAM-dependent methyltransferase